MNIRRIIAPVVVIATMLLAVAALGISNAPRAQAQEKPWCVPVQVETEDNDEDALTAHIVIDGARPMTITGEVNATSPDGTTCGIGVYIAPGARATITHADIHDAQAFGVYNNGGKVTISHSQVRNILGNGESCDEEEEDETCSGGGMGGGGGETMSYTGGRHGTGILFVGYVNPDTHETFSASGTISEDVISDYGRRGISVSGPIAYARIAGNRIIAPSAPASWLNGVWIANGAHVTITGNTISNNRSPGNVGKSSSAIMIAGGSSHNGMPNFTTDAQISGNTITNNDTGVLLSNATLNDGVTLAPDTPTRNFVTGNTISTTYTVHSNDAGIRAAGGNGDRITGNVISGYVTSAGMDVSIVITPQSVNTIERGNIIK
jgi:hypothetical protein